MSAYSFTLLVKVITKASQNVIVGFEGETLKIKVTSVPEKGKANQAVITLLSRWLKVPKSSITIVKGETSSQKSIHIENCPLSASELKVPNHPIIEDDKKDNGRNERSSK